MEGKQLTYEIICDAVKGEPKAQEFLLNYYDAYINSLVMMVGIADNGEDVYHVDEDIKIQIQHRLLEGTRRWRLMA